MSKNKLYETDLTYEIIKNYLKKFNTINNNKYSEYNENIFKILKLLNKESNEIYLFSKQVVISINKLFIELQIPRILLGNNYNVLPNMYIFYKLTEILGIQYKFPSFINNNNILKYDKVWKNICSLLDWKYISTIAYTSNNLMNIFNIDIDI